MIPVYGRVRGGGGVGEMKHTERERQRGVIIERCVGEIME